MIGKALVYGGSGALGRALVSKFRSRNWTVFSVDFKENPDASHSIVLDRSVPFENLTDFVANKLQGHELDAVINVAGGWAGGNAASKDFATNVDLMHAQSVKSSIIAAQLSVQFLKMQGILALVGANAALNATPGMIAYGMAKAAVHHLTRSLAKPDSGLNGHVICILPETLDTPMNRKFMPDADFGSWTSLETIADQLFEWSLGNSRPTNGSLIHLKTRNSKTDFIAVS